MSFQRDLARKSQKGFTLIELLVVVALITLISLFAVPSISSYFQISLSSATREVAGVVKDAYNTTLITGRIHRVVYDLKNNQYWVEQGPTSGALLDTKESREREEERRRFEIDTPKKKSVFSMDTSVTRKKRSLPRGVTFQDIFTEQSKHPQTAETTKLVYTHIFPNGLTEETLIHLKDTSKHHTSLAITPIMGRTDVYGRYIKPEDAFGK